MTAPTSAPPPLAKLIGDLSKLAADVRALLGSQKETLSKAGLSFPPGVMDGLARLRDSLEKLQPTIAAQEGENSRLRALADTSSVVNSSLDLTTVLNEVMDTIIRLTGAERGFLMLKDDKGELQFRIARNVDRESLDKNEFQVSRTIVEAVAESGEPVVTTNAQADPRFSAQESVIGYNLRSIVCVPLKVKGVVTGVIYVDNRIRTGLFTERERDLLAAFANQAAIAIENARQFQQVTELKNLLDNVFASIASGVITTDVQDMVTLCNRAAESILGHAAARLVGRPLVEILPAVDEGFDRMVSKVKREHQPVIGHEVQPVFPERGALNWSMNVAPLKDTGQGSQGLAIVLDDLTETRRLQAQRQLFQRMVSPAIINKLDPNKLQLGGERVEITALFADIRGFTTFSESLDPVKLVGILNRYLAVAADAILTQEGTIDKFMGDAVMAWFNAPVPQPDHTLRAVRAALNMREDLRALHEEIEPEFRLSFGVGIHYGEAVIGLVGTNQKLEYTAIGDSVNTAKRIQENAKPLQILISRMAYERVKSYVVAKELEAIKVKGRAQPVALYEVLDLKR